jgi:site-specific recombinase XerD
MTATAAKLHVLPAPAPAEAGRFIWEREVDRWERHLRAKGSAPKTLYSYSWALKSVSAWLEAEGHSLDPAAMTAAIGDAYMEHLHERQLAKATRVGYYTALGLFYGWWASAESERREEPVPSPWVGVGRPKLGKPPRVPVIPDDTLGRLLAATEGVHFLDRRDNAMLRLMADTGLRRHEVVGIVLEDVDLRHRRALVYGKGNKVRAVAWGADTAVALDKYLAKRERHPNADELFTVGREDAPRTGHPLFMGHHRTGVGPISPGAVSLMLARRSREAGVERTAAHRFRHTWAHDQKAAGTPDDELMATGGWDSTAMLVRYGRAEAESRALANYHSPMDARKARRRGR